MTERIAGTLRLMCISIRRACLLSVKHTGSGPEVVLCVDHRSVQACVCSYPVELNDWLRPGTHTCRCDHHQQSDFERPYGVTDLHILLMTFWVALLLINRLAWPMIASSIALPTRSSGSSLSAFTMSRTSLSAPKYTPQLVVNATVRWTTL
jgi:hypothetical protein